MHCGMIPWWHDVKKAGCPVARWSVKHKNCMMGMVGHWAIASMLTRKKQEAYFAKSCNTRVQLVEELLAAI